MPEPKLVPHVAWEAAETKEMEQIVGLYGKTYHLWQVDRGDVVPMGAPELMGSFTSEDQLGRFEGILQRRDERFGVQMHKKAEVRNGIETPVVESGESCRGRLYNWGELTRICRCG